MEYDRLREDFERGKKLIIVDVERLGGKVLDIIDYFDSLPKSWDIRYFHSGSELKSGIQCNNITNNTLVVLPTDEDLDPGEIYTYSVQQNVKILVVIGKRGPYIEDRDKLFYFI